MADQIKIEILEDGQISIETDKISGKNHASADEFLAEIEKLAGGPILKQKKKGIHRHTHQHTAMHVH
jgi:hypothetical protein